MKIINLALGAIAAILLTACGTTQQFTVPVTGRTQKINVTDYGDAAMLALSEKEYRSELSKMTESTNATNNAMVQRVGKRLAAAVNTYLTNNGYADDAKNYSWEFHLVQKDEANAWCMPGGKIVVYEGLLPVTEDETSLAIVLGHEIAHAVARHSQENATKSKNTSTLASIASVGVGVLTDNSTVQSIANQGLSIGATALVSGYSRSNETEADHIGLIFAAMAGYDPNEAVTFWQRMAQQSGGNSGGLFSTHPSDAKRISDIKNTFLPEALTYYNTGKTTTTASANKTSSSTKTTKKSSPATQTGVKTQKSVSVDQLYKNTKK